MTRTRSNLLLLFVALIWGSAFVAQALGTQALGPLLFTGLRFALGAVVIAPLASREWVRLQREGRAPGRRDAAHIALLGMLLFAGSAMQQVGLMTTSVTHAGFLTALYVPLVPVLGWLLFAQVPHWSIWPAATGCLLGTWLLTAGTDAFGLPAIVPAGDLWMLVSSLPWALHVLLVGRTAHRMHGPMVVATGQFAVCGSLSLASGLLFEPWQWSSVHGALGAIVYTGVLSVGVGFTLQVVGQRHARAADCAIVLSSETVFAALFGAFFMGDRLGPAGLAGCAIILSCVLLIQVQPLLRSLLKST